MILSFLFLFLETWLTYGTQFRLLIVKLEVRTTTCSLKLVVLLSSLAQELHPSFVLSEDIASVS